MQVNYDVEKQKKPIIIPPIDTASMNIDSIHLLPVKITNCLDQLSRCIISSSESIICPELRKRLRSFVFQLLLVWTSLWKIEPGIFRLLFANPTISYICLCRFTNRYTFLFIEYSLSFVYLFFNHRTASSKSSTQQKLSLFLLTDTEQSIDGLIHASSGKLLTTPFRLVRGPPYASQPISSPEISQ